MKPKLIDLQIQLHQQNAQSRASKPSRRRKCPDCAEIELVATLRQGIEIDCCPKCRGVWLDRGELERFIEYASQTPTELRIHQVPPGGEDGGNGDPLPLPHHRGPGVQSGRRRSWLLEIFE